MEKDDECAGPFLDLVLHLRVSPDEAFCGWVTTEGQPAWKPFRGWIDFMGLVAALRANPGVGRSDRQAQGGWHEAHPES